MNKLLYVTYLLAGGFALPMLTTPVPVNAQQMPAMPQIEHVALNLALAKQAIDATLFIRANYKDGKFTDAGPAGMISIMKARGVYDKILIDLRGFGFASTEQWSKTAVSTAIAVGFIKNGGSQNMTAQMQQMQNDSRMSEDMKARIIATMQAVVPPQNNIDVAREILADPSYAAKVSKLFDN